ncbi:MAG: cysteine--tRNA ligase [Defluviitaleaceae bacterium]|nr:cysteine--tRNA ligase [Defluviitaleaceae bacterium]
MRFYNTLTRKKEEFVPVEDGKAGIYVCGPTTYNLIHVGNARPYVVFDTLRRYMAYIGYDVKLVQNFTDIDDKIIAKANDEGVDFHAISSRYIDEVFVDIDGLNVMRATHYPRVTEEIDDIIKLVESLIAKGFAYEKNGTVYFRAAKAKDYGKLSKKNIDELEAGARVAANPDKEAVSDFVLWKAAKEGEPFWDSPWGCGRPGWHIECSVMARKYIGNTVDIHGGGDDLMFPHHENEIAQSEAAMPCCSFVNYWLHNGMLLVDNQKMAKSEGNFFLVRDVAGEYSYEILRFFLLSVHYRSPLNFSKELVEATANGYERIKNCLRNIEGEPSHAENANIEAFWGEFCKAMDDDLNTSNAIAAIFDLVRYANKDADKECLPAIKATILKMCNILGLKLEGDAPDVDVAEIEALIAKRDAAKADKNWTLSDEIRDELAQMGVVIKDTREGTKWHLSN